MTLLRPPLFYFYVWPLSKMGGFDARCCTRLLSAKSPMRNFTSHKLGRCNRGPNGHAHASDGIGYTPYSANVATSCTCSTGSIDWYCVHHGPVRHNDVRESLTRLRGSTPCTAASCSSYAVPTLFLRCSQVQSKSNELARISTLLTYTSEGHCMAGKATWVT